MPTFDKLNEMDKSDKGWSSATSLFKWRFCSLCRRCCLIKLPRMSARQFGWGFLFVRRLLASKTSSELSSSLPSPLSQELAGSQACEYLRRGISSWKSRIGIMQSRPMSSCSLRFLCCFLSFYQEQGLSRLITKCRTKCTCVIYIMEVPFSRTKANSFLCCLIFVALVVNVFVQVSLTAVYRAGGRAWNRIRRTAAWASFRNKKYWISGKTLFFAVKTFT